MFEKLKDIDVLIIDWASIKNKILLIIAILFFAGFTIGFCVGCGVENSISSALKSKGVKNSIPTHPKNGLSENFLQENLSGVYPVEKMNYEGKFI